MKREIQLLISEEFAEKIIPENDSVRLLDEIIDSLDLNRLYETYSKYGRKWATEPSVMLKILVYANMQSIYSSRDIESSCKRDINFMWLLGAKKAPDYHEIARFRSGRLSECGDEIFYQLVKKLSELGEIKLEHLFVDGTKIEANANKYSFVWKHSGYEFTDESVSEFFRYDPNTVSVRIAFTHILHRAGSADYKDKTDITYFAHKTRDDGDYLIFARYNN